MAIARAPVNSPQLILADEPASNLDTENADIVFNYLSDFHKAGGTVVMATQRNEAKQFANRILKLDNGCIVKS
ncbi:putative ABC transporter ATP-binding protein YknY [subsurface metagenome]